MRNKKIKIFLGGYVNYLNAQNINCRALSEHLDKDKFEISTMLYPIQNARDFKMTPGVKYFVMKCPVRLHRYALYLKAITEADIAFLPKWEIDGFCRFVAKLTGTKVFTTVEGLIDDVNINLVGLNLRKRKGFINHFAKYEPNLYAITQFIATDVARRNGYHFADKILYLGVESGKFLNSGRQYDGLNNIVFIGNTPSIKNIYDFMDAAKVFPDIKFHIVGGNQLKEGSVEDYISAHGLSNVVYHGRLDHTELSELLSKIDLMYFPSRSEGFPKVHLETACAGVPTLCYSDYGAEEWISSWVNGIVVKTKEEAFEAIAKLKADPEKLKAMSHSAIELGKKFDWANLVKVWEEEIERIMTTK